MRQFSKPLNCHLENKHQQIYISKKIRVNVENNVNNNTKPVPQSVHSTSGARMMKMWEMLVMHTG